MDKLDGLMLWGILIFYDLCSRAYSTAFSVVTVACHGFLFLLLQSALPVMPQTSTPMNEAKDSSIPEQRPEPKPRRSKYSPAPEPKPGESPAHITPVPVPVPRQHSAKTPVSEQRPEIPDTVDIHDSGLSGQGALNAVCATPEPKPIELTRETEPEPKPAVTKPAEPKVEVKAEANRPSPKRDPKPKKTSPSNKTRHQSSSRSPSPRSKLRESRKTHSFKVGCSFNFYAWFCPSCF